MKDLKLSLKKLTELVKKKPIIDHEIMVDSDGVFWTTDGVGAFWFWDSGSELWRGDEFPRNDLVSVTYLECFFDPILKRESDRFNLKCSGADVGDEFDKKFAATYSEPFQVGEHEHRQIRMTKVFSYRDSFLKVIEWLKSIGVKNPNINSVDISEVDE